ncbi:MAG: hypothetical protein JO309_07345 [Pseudonocardiales bacterium]|nr:hypothetical protein [Pseudonocardiales bacterium]
MAAVPRADRPGNRRGREHPSGHRKVTYPSLDTDNEAASGTMRCEVVRRDCSTVVGRHLHPYHRPFRQLKSSEK